MGKPAVVMLAADEPVAPWADRAHASCCRRGVLIIGGNCVAGEATCPGCPQCHARALAKGGPVLRQLLPLTPPLCSNHHGRVGHPGQGSAVLRFLCPYCGACGVDSVDKTPLCSPPTRAYCGALSDPCNHPGHISLAPWLAQPKAPFAGRPRRPWRVRMPQDRRGAFRYSR